MIMVGDSRNDILAAKAAGCPSIGVTFGYGDMAELSKHEATRPDWTIGSLPEIYENLRPQREEKRRASENRRKRFFRRPQGLFRPSIPPNQILSDGL